MICIIDAYGTPEHHGRVMEMLLEEGDVKEFQYQRDRQPGSIRTGRTLSCDSKLRWGGTKEIEMNEFKDRVAVITGASSGIGFGIARKCAQEGMKVVLAGINYDNLLQAEKKLEPLEVETLCIQTDVSKREEVEALARRAQDAYGVVHLLVNNAGVGAGTTVWESTWQDWEWVLDVNVWGVIHGSKIFVPMMLAQDAPGHIVNVSSIAGFMPTHLTTPYQVSKHAVVALTESLYYSLKQLGAQVSASVLCPGNVRDTRILQGERNRPTEQRMNLNPEQQEMLAAFQERLNEGISPEECAETLFAGIREDRLYIHTHPELKSRVEDRMKAILEAFDWLSSFHS